MKKRRMGKKLQFALLFALLLMFTLSSIGMVVSKGDIVTAVSAVSSENSGADHFVKVVEPVFSAKILRFLKEEKVCALTAEQAARLALLYDTETEQFDVAGSSVYVMKVNGVPLNKHILEQALGGQLFPERCQVVHGNKFIALVSPVFVS